MKVDKCSKEYVLEIIFKVIDEHNKLNPEELKLEKKVQTILMGSDGILDSLGLINLLVEVESKFKNDLQNNFSIIDENLFLKEKGPYSNIDNLSEYILGKLSENKS